MSVLTVSVTNTRPRSLGQNVWSIIQALGLNDQRTGLNMWSLQRCWSVIFTYGYV